MNINKVTVGGRLGQDPEINYLASGTAVMNLSVATSRKWKKDDEVQEETEWHSVTVFGKLAEILEGKIEKGGRVICEGRSKTDSWDDAETGQKKYKTKIIATEVTIVDFVSGDGSSGDGYNSDN